MDTSYTQLRNGIHVPSNTLLEYSRDTYRLFADDTYVWTERLARLAIAAKDNFTAEASDAHLPKRVVDSLKSYNYSVSPMNTISTQSMARTAIAASMIHVVMFDGEFDAYIQDPVDDTNRIYDQLKL